MRRRRRRRGRVGRLPKPVILGKPPCVERFTPVPYTDSKPIIIEQAELEALRLVDLEGLSQEDAGGGMDYRARNHYFFNKMYEFAEKKSLFQKRAYELAS